MDVKQEIQNALTETAENIVQLQKAQLFSGTRNDDTPIVPPYAPATVKSKQKKGQPYDRVTLRDKGDFWAGIFSDVRSTDIYIDSADAKAGKLIGKYQNIFGLNTQSKSKYTLIVEPIFFNAIRKKLKLW